MRPTHSLLSGVLLFFLTNSASATHLFGGYITAKKVSGRTYEISLFVYSDPNSVADAGTTSVELQFGDGSRQEVTRTSTQAESARVRKSIYTIQHQYAADGSFVISYRDLNMADGVININNGRSDNLELSIETKINVTPSMDDTYCPQPLAFEICNTTIKAGYVLTYNPAFTDQDDDSVAYQLVSPLELTKQGYEIPEGMGIHAYSGTISWPLSQKITGAYLLYYRVNSYRDGILLSSSLIAQPFFVNTAGITFPSNTEAPGCDLAPAGWLRKVVLPGDLVSQDFISNTQEGGFSYSLTAYSGLFLKNADSSSTLNAGNKTIHINWQTVHGDFSTLPYFIVYRQRALNGNFINDHVLGVYVGAPLTTGLNGISKNKTAVSVYPNPVKASCRFLFELSGETTLTIADITGKQVFRSPVYNGFEWSRGRVPQGIYSFTLQSSDGFMHRGKLILE